ncbi:MAG: type II secretion system protein GspK [Nibricoccus sp.]
MNPRVPTSLPCELVLARPAPVARRARGSVLLVVLVTIAFVTVALTAFIERSMNDLLVEHRAYAANRLRLEACSVLETTLAVLEDFRLANGSLKSPAEGWGDPLTWVGYEPAEGHKVEVTFIDESGKFSLPNVTQSTLLNLFKDWGLSQSEGEIIADAILGWMKADYVPTSASAPDKDDYEREEIPFTPPGRPMRSFDELATIAVARDVFYDDAGQPNELWHRFASAFSLYSYQSPSLNGATPELLAGLGASDANQQKQLNDYLAGRGVYESNGPGFFKSAADAATILGAQSPATQLDTQIRALRIIVTVREGRSAYRINALIAPPNGATIPAAAPPRKADTTKQNEGQTSNNPPTPAVSNTSGATQTAKKLNYPFTILEFRENDEMPSPITPPTSS